MSGIMDDTLGESLSKALQRYYTRKGNRLLFSNGMTLNQLALDMWERLGYEGMDASVLSRILSGKRLFTVKQLRVFRDTLNIPHSEQEKLKELLLVDLNHRFGMGDAFWEVKNSFFLELVEDNLKKIEKVRGNGLPALALVWSYSIHEEINSRKNTFTDEIQKRRMLELLSLVLIEQTKALQDNSSQDQIKLRFPSISKELREISHYLKDKNILGYSHYVSGNLFYILKKYDQMLPHALKVYRYLKDNESIKAAKLKDIAIYYASRNQPEIFKNVKRNILKKVGNLQKEEVICELLEGVVAGEILLGLEKEAEDSLEKAWAQVEKMELQESELREIRKIQVIRTNLLFEDKFKKGKNLSNLEKLGKEAVWISNNRKFERHGAQIERLLDRILNNKKGGYLESISYVD